MTTFRTLVSPSSLALMAAAAIGYAGYSMMRSRIPHLPLPGAAKQDPEQLDKMHDVAVEDSMAASDPPSTTRPEVRN